MVYNVLVKRVNGHFTAMVLGLPNLVVEAPTRSEAVNRAQAAVAEMLAEGELIRIEVSPKTSPRPLVSFAGMWADDEFFDDFVAAMDSYRREIDAASRSA